MVQPGNLQVLFIRVSFFIENKIQKNNKKLDEEKQIGKTYVANVSTKIGLNFVFSVFVFILFLNAMFFIQMEILPRISFFTDLVGRCGELTGAGED